MAQEFFKNFPNIQYKLSDGKVITIKDFFRKSKIEQESVTSLVEYTTYELEEGDRPDTVASKIYGNGDLHWTLYLVNDLDNYFDWFKTSQEFEEYIKQKYDGYLINANNTSDIIDSSSKFLLGEKVKTTQSEGIVIKVDPTHKRIGVKSIKGDFGADSPSEGTITGESSGKSFSINFTTHHRDGISHYFKGDLKRNQFDNDYQAKTFWEDEWEKNEEKRKIKIIKPAKIQQIVSAFEKVMKS